MKLFSSFLRALETCELERTGFGVDPIADSSSNLLTRNHMHVREALVVTVTEHSCIGIQNTLALRSALVYQGLFGRELASQ